MSKYIVTISEPKTLECLDSLVYKKVKIIYNNMFYIGALEEYRIIKKAIMPSLYTYSEPEYVGDFPKRPKIEILPADDPNRKPIGFKIKEKIGIGVIKTRALSKLKVSRQEDSDCDTMQNAKRLYNEDDVICYRILTHKGYHQNLFIKYYDCISIELLSDNPNDFGTLK